MAARTFSVPLDDDTAQCLETLARNDDRSPGRIIAASLRLYVRLSMEAQAAYRRVEACGSDDKRDALLAELNRAIIGAADAIPRKQARPPGVKEAARPPAAQVSSTSSPSQPEVSVASESKQVFSVTDFCRTYGVSRTTAYAELKEGTLKAKKIGRRTVILRSEAERWLTSLRDR